LVVFDLFSRLLTLQPIFTFPHSMLQITPRFKEPISALRTRWPPVFLPHGRFQGVLRRFPISSSKTHLSKRLHIYSLASALDVSHALTPCRVPRREDRLAFCQQRCFSFFLHSPNISLPPLWPPRTRQTSGPSLLFPFVHFSSRSFRTSRSRFRPPRSARPEAAFLEPEKTSGFGTLLRQRPNFC